MNDLAPPNQRGSPSQPGSMPRRTRGRRQTALDMVRSLAVIAAVGWVVYALVPRSDVPLERVVDAPAVLSLASAKLGTDLPPPELPPGWRATSARWDADTQAVHIGYLTADDEYAEAAFTLDPTPRWLHAATAEGAPVVRGPEQPPGQEAAERPEGGEGQEQADGQPQADALVISGQPWERWESAQSGRESLVRQEATATKVVTGTAAPADLALLAAAVFAW